MVTWGYVTEQKQNISSSAKPMATRPGRVVTYDKRTSPVMSMAIKLSKLMTYGEVNTSIKSHIFLTTWLHKVTWQTKNRIFLPSEDFWPSNFAGCWHMVGEAHNEVARSQEATWPQEVMCQIENLISPLLQGLYHHTWPCGDVWLCDHAALWGHTKNLKQKFKFICKN